MNNNIRNVLQRHRKVVVLSVVAIALAVYMFPLDSLLSNQATAAPGGNRNNPYGNVNQGPPSSTPGQGPPSSTPGNGPPEDRGPPAPRGGGGGGPPRP